MCRQILQTVPFVDAFECFFRYLLDLKELSASTNGHTLYLLDEPSTGLHLVDIEKLYALLTRLVDSGHTVIMVEHHTELIAAADWVIDLGPGGGQDGGRLVASGTPHELAQTTESYTGSFLKSVR